MCELTNEHRYGHTFSAKRVMWRRELAKPVRRVKSQEAL